MSKEVKLIKSKAEFDQLIAKDKVILIDFYADWCGPCRQISPVFASLAAEHEKEGSVEFYKVDIDSAPDIAQALQISSIPTFHAYKNNQKIDHMVGANKAGLQTLVKKGVALRA